jgi:hypothetical protein
MPSGKKDIYGVKSKALYKAGSLAGEIGAARNAAIPASKRNSNREIEALLRREGTTNASGGRPAVKMPAKTAPVKMPAKQQVIRTTVSFKPTPTGKKK